MRNTIFLDEKENNFVPYISMEDLYNDGIVSGYESPHLYATIEGQSWKTSFFFVSDVERYAKSLEKKYGGEVKFHAIKLDTDCDGYDFFKIVCKEEGEESEQHIAFAATPLFGSKRRFGSAYFRTIKDIISYMRAQEDDTKGVVWEDDKGVTYTADDLEAEDISKRGTKFWLKLDDFSIFDRNEKCILARKED